MVRHRGLRTGYSDSRPRLHLSLRQQGLRPRAYPRNLRRIQEPAIPLDVRTRPGTEAPLWPLPTPPLRPPLSVIASPEIAPPEPWLRSPRGGPALLVYPDCRGANRLDGPAP